MLLRRLARALALLTIVVPSIASSLGLGDIKVDTALNQPLRAQIKLLAVEPSDPDNLRVSLASPTAFERVGIERPFVLTELQFKPVQAADSSTLIEVTTKQPVREPFLNFLVEVEWPNGRLLREYAVLLDPPVLTDQPGAVMAQTPVVASQDEAAPVAPIPAAEADRQFTRAKAQPDYGLAQEELARSIDGARVSPSKYSVVPGDTLGEIAQHYLPDGNTDLSQMMMAIQRTNPDAFSQGNINNLKTGVILRIPAKLDIVAVDRQEALAAVTRQNNLWREYKAEVTGAFSPPLREGATAAAPPSNGAAKRAMAAPTGQQDKLRESTAVHSTAGNDAGSNSTEGGQLEIMGPEHGGANAQAATAGGGSEDSKLQANEPLARELVESQRVEIDSLSSKVAELESMVSKQAHIIAVQGKALADLQRRLDLNAEPAVAQDKQAPTSKSPIAKENAPTPQAQPDTIATNAKPMAMSDPTAQETESDQAAPPASVLMQGILANPAMLAGIGGSVVLLLALAWLVVRRAASTRGEAVDLATYADEDSDNKNEAAQAVPASAAQLQAQNNPGASEPAGLTAAAGSVPAESQAADAPTPETVNQETEQRKNLNDDTLAEADVYIAYALYQQAEDLLKEAIARNPKNENYRLKLLEAYYAAKNRAGFDLEAQALNESSSGSPSPVWDRVMIMGRDLSPHNPLFYDPAIGGLDTADSAVAPSEPADASGESGRQEDVTAANTGAGGIATSEQIVLNTENAAQSEWVPSDLPHARVEGHKLRHYQ
jgi:pilus assembly protein FimV